MSSDQGSTGPPPSSQPPSSGSNSGGGSGSGSGSSSGGTSAPRPPSLNQGPTQCLTPPTHRRREARIAYCQNLYATQAQGAGEATAPIGEGYNQQEIDTREVNWNDWVVPDGTDYTPNNAGRVLGPDGLVRTWEPGQPEWWLDGGDATFLRVAGLGQNAHEGYRDFLEGIENTPMNWEQANAAQQQGRLAVEGHGGAGNPAQPSTGLGALPDGALPLLLGAVYLFARAFGIAPGAAARRRRQREDAAEGKPAQLARR